ncbi:hypothetical protein [Nocardia sp. CNY236]|uniref:hypothetical protein n=1 Tax=Nocardia sp. CNY236 TaxID=1169152 RepID=UPI0004174539|nr:hypothetical protein [Nocardia sp. CNY236]
MADERLTPKQLAGRWHGRPNERTLAQWRYLRVGPDYIKVGKHVFYPLSSVLEFEERNTVKCNGVGA